MQRLDDGYSLEEPAEVFGHTSIKTAPVYADYWSGRLVDIWRREKRVGVRGFEPLCTMQTLQCYEGFRSDWFPLHQDFSKDGLQKNHLK